jgi:hypothetical protein
MAFYIVIGEISLTLQSERKIDRVIKKKNNVDS